MCFKTLFAGTGGFFDVDAVVVQTTETLLFLSFSIFFFRECVGGFFRRRGRSGLPPPLPSSAGSALWDHRFTCSTGRTPACKRRVFFTSESAVKSRIFLLTGTRISMALLLLPDRFPNLEVEERDRVSGHFFIFRRKHKADAVEEKLRESLRIYSLRIRTHVSKMQFEAFFGADCMHCCAFMNKVSIRVCVTRLTLLHALT